MQHGLAPTVRDVIEDAKAIQRLRERAGKISDFPAEWLHHADGSPLADFDAIIGRLRRECHGKQPLPAAQLLEVAAGELIAPYRQIDSILADAATDLVPLLKHGSVAVRNAARGALQALGKDVPLAAVRDIVGLLSIGDPQVERAALRALLTFSRDKAVAAIPAVQRLLDNCPDPATTCVACDLLGRMAVEAMPAVPALVRIALVAPRSEESRHAATALAHILDGAAPLAQILRDPGTRDGLLEALAGAGGVARRFRERLAACPFEPEPPDAGGNRPTNRFEFDGKTWVLQFEGGKLFPMQNLMGLHDLRHLLRKPGTTFTPSELLQQARPRPAPRGNADATQLFKPGHDGGEVADEQTIEDVARCKCVMEDALREHQAAGELDKCIELEDKIREYDRYLKRARTPAGRKRKFQDGQKNARQTLKNAIERAIRSIGERDAKFGQYLDNNIHRKGNEFRYCPHEPRNWLT